MKRCLALAMLLFLGGSNIAFGQDDRPRARAAGTLGAGRTWDDEGSLGSGVAAGGRVEWRLFGNTSVEGGVDLLTHDRAGTFFESNGHSLIVGASLVHRFGDAAAQPYILEGIDIVHHSGRTRVGDLSRERTSTDPAFHGGAGVAVRVGRRFEIGPEGRFYFIRPRNSSDPAWAWWIGGRVSVRLNGGR